MFPPIFFLNTFLTIIFLSSNVPCFAKGPKVFCPLIWVPAGNGKVPLNALECAEGTSDILARVYHDSKWIYGRLIPNEGKVLISNGHEVFHYDTYQILTVPSYCDVIWMDGSASSIPDHSVATDEKSTSMFVGRTTSKFRSFCGNIDTSLDTISFANDDGINGDELKFQFLTSTYPPLSVNLTNIQFTIDPSINDASTISEIIGQQKYSIGIGIAGKFEQEIRHSKRVTEYFSIEESFKWSGVENVYLSFSKFFGTSDFSGSILNIPDNVNSLEFYSERELFCSSKVSVERTGNPNVVQRMQICSVAKIIESDNPDDIIFSGFFLFYSERLNGEQINNVLEGLGRPIGIIENENNIRVPITDGKMRGRFVLNTEILIEAPDPDRICSAYS